MSHREALHSALYRLGSAAVLALLRLPCVHQPLNTFAKVWLRHARIAAHLRAANYDQVVDGGANVGEFSALVRAVLPDVPLLCIEPHPGAAAVLRRRGFQVVQGALWNESGTAILSQPTDASTSSTLLGSAPGRPQWTVPTMRLDELPLTGNRVLLKLDLQGAEPEALEGLGKSWSRLAALLLEVSYGPRGTYECLRASLAAHGFHEAATLNELDRGGSTLEADKLWLRSEADET
jgi:FkbM family methyltransferase